MMKPLTIAYVKATKTNKWDCTNSYDSATKYYVSYESQWDCVGISRRSHRKAHSVEYWTSQCNVLNISLLDISTEKNNYLLQTRMKPVAELNMHDNKLLQYISWLLHMCTSCTSVCYVTCWYIQRCHQSWVSDSCAEKVQQERETGEHDGDVAKTRQHVQQPHSPSVEPTQRSWTDPRTHMWGTWHRTIRWERFYCGYKQKLKPVSVWFWYACTVKATP